MKILDQFRAPQGQVAAAFAVRPADDYLVTQHTQDSVTILVTTQGPQGDARANKQSL